MAARRTRRAIEAVAFAIAALAGCTRSQTLAPWLRVYTYHPFELIAESGSHAHGDAWVERRVGTRWITTRRFTPSGFAFAHGERVVLGDQLLTRDGRTIGITCGGGSINGGLRVTPHDELICIEVRTWLTRDVPAEARETIRIVRFDHDGAMLGERVVPVPVPRPADAPPLSLSIDTDFVGFLGDEFVFSVLVSREHESWAPDAWKHATAYALDATGHWRVLGTMQFRVGDLWMLHSPSRWSGVLHTRIERGTTADGPE